MNRRTFVKTTTAATAGLVIAPQVALQQDHVAALIAGRGIKTVILGHDVLLHYGGAWVRKVNGKLAGGKMLSWRSDVQGATYGTFLEIEDDACTYPTISEAVKLLSEQAGDSLHVVLGKPMLRDRFIGIHRLQLSELETMQRFREAIATHGTDPDYFNSTFEIL